jgi:hypothetical protein
MTNSQIEKFLQQKHLDQVPVRVSLKSRKSFVGMFIRANDYAELKEKNYWRIVWETNIDHYRESKDMNLVRIFNGVEITKLAAV